MQSALQVAQRVYVMENREITLSGVAGEILDSDTKQRENPGG